MAGPYDHLAGELNPGDKGWLPLDVAGKPIGPATLLPPPPGPGVFACAVIANSEVPLPPDEDLLLTAAGAPITDENTAAVDKRYYPDGQSYTPPAPTIVSTSPDKMASGDVDQVLNVHGTGFTPASIIVFNGGDEPTTLVDAGHITTGVKPSLNSVPVTVPIQVRNDLKLSNSVDFHFIPLVQLNPILTSITPPNAKVSAGNVTIVYTGTHFHPQSKIEFAAVKMTPTYVNSTTLNLTVNMGQYTPGNALTHVENDTSLSISKTFTLKSALDDPEEGEAEGAGIRRRERE